MPIFVGTATSSFLRQNYAGVPRRAAPAINAGVGTAAGSLVYSTSSDKLRVYSGTVWIDVAGGVTATGGSKSTTPAGLTLHTFTTSDTFTITNGPPSGVTVNYLVVGGGGGGATGGGGAGGYRSGTVTVPGPFPRSGTVVVGGGGNAGIDLPGPQIPFGYAVPGALGSSSRFVMGSSPTRAFTSGPALLYHIDFRNPSSYPGSGTVVNNLVPSSPMGGTSTIGTTPGTGQTVRYVDGGLEMYDYFPGRPTSNKNPNFIQFPSTAGGSTFPGQWTAEIRFRTLPYLPPSPFSRNAIFRQTESGFGTGSIAMTFNGSPMGGTSLTAGMGPSLQITLPAASYPHAVDTEYHYVLLRDSGNILRLYRNGTLAGSSPGTNTTAASLGPAFLIGSLKASNETFSDYAGIRVILFRFYNTALSAPQITDNYNQTETTNPAYVNIVSTGGGGGGGYPNTEGAGMFGGSGGGAGGSGNPVPLNSIPGGSGNYLATTPSQGNSGGTSGSTTTNLRAGGGGGAGGSGGNGGGGPGTGGNGSASTITGSSVTYAGGGGGGRSPGNQPAAGGTGGGGNAGSTGAGQPGTATLGGGGGGGNGAAGGSGGSGVVLISY